MGAHETSSPIDVRSRTLIGRDVDRDRLGRVVDAVRRAEGAAAFVIGEAGIGKSRLADEVAAEAAEAGIRVLRGRAGGAATSSMRPFTEALLRLARTGWAPAAELLGPYRAVLGHLVPDWRTPEQARVPSVPIIYGEAVLRVLGAAGPHGCLLILEDLHEADADTVAVLQYVVDNLDGQPVAVIGTARDVDCPALDVAGDAQRRGIARVMELGRLDDRACADLVAACLAAGPGELPDDLAASLSRHCAGNPLVLEEMLRGMIAGGALVAGPGGWTRSGEPTTTVPGTLARDLALRIEAAGTATRELLRAAAVIGDEFPAELLGATAGIAGAALTKVVEDALRDHFLIAAPTEGWLAFYHPLTEQATRAGLAPATVAELSGKAADAIEGLYPGLTGPWCSRAAALHAAAGDAGRASTLFAEAGRRADHEGKVTLAVQLLRRARDLQPADADLQARANLLAALASALGETGRYEDAFRETAQVDELVAAGLPASVAADLHARLARVALRACWADRGIPHLRAARALLGDRASAAQRAELDAIDAYITLEVPAEHHAATAESLATRAIETARAANLPAVECDALLTLGYRYGNRKPDAAMDCYRRAYALASEHDLPGYRIESLRSMGAHQWMWAADTTMLAAAIDEVGAIGAVLDAHHLALHMAVDALFRTDFTRAEELIDDAWRDIARLKLPGLGSYALAVRVLLHAHRGRAAEMNTALAEFTAWRGDRPDEVPLAEGGRGLCALVRGEVAEARPILAGLGIADDGEATKYYLCGQYGLAMLVEVAEGAAGWAEYHQVAAQTASGLPWNRQFVALARAVLLGRAGDRERAQAAVEEAMVTAQPFPLARHLGLRLIAPAAADDRWGEPVRWLYEAEAFFAGIEVPSAARSCRDLLRRMGKPTRQWRDGADEVPPHLWTMGVTVREYQVLVELARHRTNREIADEMHLSHRTVERHVANLLTKTSTTNRRDLVALTTPG